MQEIDIRNLDPIFTTPCNGCTTCCHGLVQLVEGEDYPYYRREGRRFLKKTVEGKCIYLQDDGCAVHEDPPRMCSTFDCGQVVKAGFGHVLLPEVEAQGSALLEAGYAPDVPAQLTLALTGIRESKYARASSS